MDSCRRDGVTAGQSREIAIFNGPCSRFPGRQAHLAAPAQIMISISYFSVYGRLEGLQCTRFHNIDKNRGQIIIILLMLSLAIKFMCNV